MKLDDMVERDLTDVAFHNAVTFLSGCVELGTLTPHDIRDAAFLAEYRTECKRPIAVQVLVQEKDKIEMLLRGIPCHGETGRRF